MLHFNGNLRQKVSDGFQYSLGGAISGRGGCRDELHLSTE
jgi:hypothetical protein